MSYARRIGTDASMDRLEKLIEKRLEPGADKEKIDERIMLSTPVRTEYSLFSNNTISLP